MILFGFGCAVGVAATALFYHFAVVSKLHAAIIAAERRSAELFGSLTQLPK
jgi:hypothetical protein